jgi:hypothetical protein
MIDRMLAAIPSLTFRARGAAPLQGPLNPRLKPWASFDHSAVDADFLHLLTFRARGIAGGAAAAPNSGLKSNALTRR